MNERKLKKGIFRHLISTSNYFRYYVQSKKPATPENIFELSQQDKEFKKNLIAIIRFKDKGFLSKVSLESFSQFDLNTINFFANEDIHHPKDGEEGEILAVFASERGCFPRSLKDALNYCKQDIVSLHKIRFSLLALRSNIYVNK